MRTKPLIYRKGFLLWVAIVFLLALAAPAEGQKKKSKTSGEQSNTNAVKDESAKDKQKDEQEKASNSSNSRASSSNNKNTSTSTSSTTKNNPEPPNPKIDELDQEIAKIKESYVSAESLGLLAWLTTPVLGLIALLLLIALALHLFHLLRLSSLNHFVTRLAASHAALGQATKGDRGQVNNTGVEKLAGELDRHGQVLIQLSNRLNQVDGRVTASSAQVEDALQAITLTASWMGQSQLSAAFAADGESISDSERASAISMLERYREPLRQNANRVEAVSQALAELVDLIGGRAYASSDLSSRVQSLFQEIHRFERWHTEVADELKSLQLGSFGQRNYLFQLGQDRLKDQVNQGSLSVAQMVQKSRELMQDHFPEPAHRPVKENLALADREANLKKIRDGACDYLMDWYNNLFQFQHQLEQGQRSAAEAELAVELSRIQHLAREALNKFDVQPEAIQIGQTKYDRRLHEAILVRQSQFPLNTVIDIHECGFRKMSTGEALRRPQVIVAGSGAN